MKSKESTKKTIPGAVFIEKTSEKPKKEKAPIETVNKMMSEIKISTAITGEQIEAEMKVKQIRKLKKQLREIEQLEEKMKSTNLEKDQLEKVKKKEQLLFEIEQLED